MSLFYQYLINLATKYSFCFYTWLNKLKNTKIEQLLYSVYDKIAKYYYKKNLKRIIFYIMAQVDKKYYVILVLTVSIIDRS